MIEGITQAEFARQQGYSTAWVSKLKKAGRLVFADDGKVDPDESLRLMGETSDPNQDHTVTAHAKTRKEKAKEAAATAGKPDPKPIHRRGPPKGQPVVPGPVAAESGYDFQRHRALKEKYLALQAKSDYERNIGKLVERVAVEQVVEDVIITLKSALENIPSRVASELVGHSVPEIERHLRGEITRALSDLQREVKKQIDAAAKN